MSSAGRTGFYLAGAVFLTGILLFDDLFEAAILGVVALGVVFLGAAYPDIDHHASIPFRYLRTIVSYLGGAVALLAVGWALGRALKLAYDQALEAASWSLFLGGLAGYNLGRAIPGLLLFGVLIVGLVMAVVAGIVDWLRPKHRGPTHEASVGRLVSVALGVGTWWLLSVSPFFDRAHAAGTALAVILAFYIGLLDHLSVDGLLE